MPNKRSYRADHEGEHRNAYGRNKAKLIKLAGSTPTCALCGKAIDTTKRWPDPLCLTVDHIIPVHLGGHPSAIENLQLAHFTCNRQKSDKMMETTRQAIGERMNNETIRNDILPQHADWMHYKPAE